MWPVIPHGTSLLLISIMTLSNVLFVRLLSANVTHIVNLASEVPNYYEKIFFHDDEFQFVYRK